LLGLAQHLPERLAIETIHGERRDSLLNSPEEILRNSPLLNQGHHQVRDVVGSVHVPAEHVVPAEQSDTRRQYSQANSSPSGRTSDSANNLDHSKISEALITLVEPAVIIVFVTKECWVAISALNRFRALSTPSSQYWLFGNTM
jgi:hypothetical protein